MGSKTLNQVLADTLNRLMTERNLSNYQLGRLAHVAPNTIANYRNAAGDKFTSTGKERSAKLAEVERIARALHVHPLALLTDPAEHARRAAHIAHMLAEPAPDWPGPPPKPRRDLDAA